MSRVLLSCHSDPNMQMELAFHTLSYSYSRRSHMLEISTTRITKKYAQEFHTKPKL